MRLFTCNEIEEFQTLMEYIISLDQPLFIYKSDSIDNVFLVSDLELENADDEIQKIIEERKKEKDEKGETLEESLFDFSDDEYDDEDFWLML